MHNTGYCYTMHWHVNLCFSTLRVKLGHPAGPQKTGKGYLSPPCSFFCMHYSHITCEIPILPAYSVDGYFLSVELPAPDCWVVSYWLIVISANVHILVFHISTTGYLGNCQFLWSLRCVIAKTHGTSPTALYKGQNDIGILCRVENVSN